MPIRDSEPTLRELARESGVSAMTVSNVLRNIGRFNEETRRKVIETAERLNYRPDPEIARLMGRLRTPSRQRMRPTIAFVGTWSPHHDEDVEGYFQQVYRGAIERAEKRGYNIDRFLLGKTVSQARLHRTLSARRIEAMLVTPWAKPGAHMHFPWEDFAVAAASNALWKPALNRSAPHHYNNMLLALHHARHLGYRRPALVLRREDDRLSVHAWWAAYLWYTNSHPILHALPVLCERTLTLGAFGNWLSKNTPDLILSSLNFPLDWMRKLGHRVPADIGFINLGGHGGGDDITQIDQRPRLVGEAAIDLLISQVQSNEKGLPAAPKVVMVEGHWIPGGTTRSVKTPARTPKAGRTKPKSKHS